MDPRSPLPPGGEVRGFLTYRKRTRGGRPRYYVYSPDCERLIIAAQERSYKSAIFKISVNSCVFKKSSTDYIGTLYHTEGSRACNLVIPNPYGRMPTEVLRVSFTRTRIGAPVSIALVWNPLSDPSLFDQNCNYEAISQGSAGGETEIVAGTQCSPSPQNQVFTYGGRPCFCIAKAHDDEWHFFVANPLSVFVGFGIALAILRKLPPT